MLMGVIPGVFRDTVRSLRSWRRTPGSALMVVLALGLFARSVDDISLFRDVLLCARPTPVASLPTPPRVGFCRTPWWSQIEKTTQALLDHFDLASLDDLPRIEELLQVGLLGGAAGAATPAAAHPTEDSEAVAIPDDA